MRVAFSRIRNALNVLVNTYQNMPNGLAFALQRNCTETLSLISDKSCFNSYVIRG